jgi:predicted neutral ceramidase superfamily lipid hydrolase
LDTDTPQERVKAMPGSPSSISGFGGWLVLVQIGLYMTFFLQIVQLLQYSLPALGAGTWDVLTSKDSELYDPLWGTVIVFEAVYNVFFLVFTAFIMIQFYRQKASLPLLMIIFYGLSLLIGILDYVLLAQIPLAQELEDGSSIKDLVSSLFTCLIWIPYFIRSVRVKNTFVK